MPFDFRDLEESLPSIPTEVGDPTSSPSVTLMLSTTPAAAMTVLDVARLRQLAERARRRLAGEPDREGATELVENRLSMALSRAESQATDRGLAVMVSSDDLAIVTLPFAPRDRHVVDTSFATRDLDYALRRYDRHRVLVLDRPPRVLEGHAHQLIEADTPCPRRAARINPTGGHFLHPDPDSLLGERVRTAGPLPLVVVGDQRDIEGFRRRSRYADQVVTTVHRSRFHRINVPDLVADALDHRYQTRQSESVARLLHADVQSQIAWGLRAAWGAVVRRTADQIWVEHDYAVPGRITPGADDVATTNDPEEPGAVDDLLDGLLTKAAQVGIEAHVLDRHTLGRPEPVAARIPIGAPTDPGKRKSLVMA